MLIRFYPKVLIIILSTLILFNKTFAQLCQGSLGDPVVNITFGTGANPGQSLSSAVTNYNFVSDVCPNDGMYTIANSTANCFNSTWYTLPEDHTPNDVNGYMMIVNASFAPGDFYVQPVSGLCENTTYEFAAWILNILKATSCGYSIKPNVTFNIETASGTVLQTYQTGDIPNSTSPQWKQYGSFFTTPAGTTSVVIRITNNAPGGCGNDLVLDDITFRPCGALVTAIINGNLKSVNICSGNTSSYTFTGNISSGYNNPVYQWQVSNNAGNTWQDIPGANKITYSKPPGVIAGVFQYRLAVATGSNISVPGCRVVSDVVTVNINPVPLPAASNSGPGCTGQSLMLQASEASIFSWTGPQGFISDQQKPIIQSAALNNSGKYYIKLSSDKGCINTDSTEVIINKSPVVYAGNDAVICEGSTTQLTATGSDITSYSWSPAASLSGATILNPVASPTETTLYIFSALNASCKTSDTVMVKVNKKAMADAGADQVILRGQHATLNGIAGGDNVFYSWWPNLYISSPGVLMPAIDPPQETTYILNVTSNIGCGSDADTVLIKVYNDVYIPNAFTPNNDGVNDTWNIETLKAFPNAEVKVFNRYGGMIFINNKNVKQWDGKYNGVLQDAGVYCYTIDLKNGRKPLKGIVVIIL